MAVISETYSGLGNQLFQYAAGRALSHKLETDLLLDISSYERDNKTTFDLALFNIKARVASFKEIKYYKQAPQNLMDTISSLVWRITKKPEFIKETAFHYNGDFNVTSKNIFLSGHWQSEKYFSAVRSELLKEITSIEVDSRQDLIKEISTCDSVALIIRRGDYLEHDHLNLYGESLEYYYNAVQYISGLISKPHFFIFSDDIDWVKKNITITHPVTFVSRVYTQKRDNVYVINPERHLDLMLIKACKHQIITNSTYAWWGAWLNENLQKIVIAPKNWFKPGYKWVNEEDVNQEDIIPVSWLRI